MHHLAVRTSRAPFECINLVPRTQIGDNGNYVF
jgi:hypothetical protein